ncbi:MAG: leucine-rich repeat protein [Clostridia bacterium]|nr:leucine-rich repeat protein [Clostridia bacterium]
MKKGKFFRTLAVFGACLGAPLLLTGCGKDETQINFRVEGEYIQWTEDGKTWTNLIELDQLQGEQGVQGPQGIQGEQGQQGLQGSQGIAGKQVEFNVSSTHIQWRYVGDETWNNLIALEDIKGEKGDNGEDGEDLTIQKVVVNFNYELHKYFSDYEDTISQSFVDKYNNSSKFTTNKGDWVDLYDFSNTPLGDYFLGWYAGTGVNETKITSYTPICDNVTLTAKFDIERIETEYYTEGLQFSLTDTCLVANTNGEILWEKTLVEDAYYVYGFTGSTQSNIVIPKTFNGKDVVGVSNLGLEKVNVDNVFLPKGLQYIGAMAFEELSNNTYGESVVIHMPSSIVAIGSNAFASARATNIDILIEDGAKFECLGTGAFGTANYNKILREDGFDIDINIGISSNATYIGEQAFDTNSKLTLFVEIAEDNLSSEVFQENWYNAENENMTIYYGEEYSVDNIEVLTWNIVENTSNNPYKPNYETVAQIALREIIKFKGDTYQERHYSKVWFDLKENDILVVNYHGIVYNNQILINSEDMISNSQVELQQINETSKGIIVGGNSDQKDISGAYVSITDALGSYQNQPVFYNTEYMFEIPYYYYLAYEFKTSTIIANTIYVKDSLVASVESEILENYTKEEASEYEGYTKYILIEE